MNTTRRLPVETQLTLLLTFGFMAAMAAAMLLIYVLRGSEPEQARIWLAAGILIVMTLAMIVTTALAHRLVLGRVKQDVETRVMTLMREQIATAEQLREAATQEERNRLARDLHDTIKQQLFSINVAAATAQSLRERDSASAANHIQQVRDLAQAANVEMKALLSQLRPQPLVTIGLIGAIEEQLDALKFRADVKTELHAGELPNEAQLPAGAHAALFRVAQEALSNIARHARASHAIVRFEQIEHGQRSLLRMTVADDGQGFDPAHAKAGMGLGNMRARIAELGGALHVQSSPGQGTTVSAELPLITAHDLREQAMREKEERYQLVYWAGGATSLLCMLGTAGLITLVALAIDIANGNTAMWAAFILTLAIVTAFAIGFSIACITLRRRVMALGGADSIWRSLLRLQDVAQLVTLTGMLAWVAFTFRQFGLAALFMVIALAAGFFSWRMGREMDARIGEWATFRMLRTRIKEMRGLLVFGITFIVLTLAGMFGDLSHVALFHERFSMAWMTSFIAVIYPVIMISSVLALVGLRRQIALLQMTGGEDEAADAAPVASKTVHRQRWAARALTLGIMLSAALVGIGFGLGQIWMGFMALAACGIMWLAKSRIEAELTANVTAWSTLAQQQSARLMYIYLLVTVLVMIAGGVVGSLVGYSSPASGESSDTANRLPQLFGLLTTVIAAPAYAGLMFTATRKRIARLQVALDAQGETVIA